MAYRYETESSNSRHCEELAMHYAVDLAADYENGYRISVEDRGDGKFAVIVRDGGVPRASIRCVPTNE